MAHSSNVGVGNSGAPSEAAAFKNVSRCMQEALQGLMRALEVKMEKRVNVLAQQIEERVGTLAERLSEVEGRIIALEATNRGQNNGGQEAAVKKLEERVQQLEASVQKALDGVIPRVDNLLQLLERNCPPAPFSVPFTSSASPPPIKRPQNVCSKTPSASTSSVQPCDLPSVSYSSPSSSASPSPLAPSPADPSSTPSTASAPSPPFGSANGIALGKELFKAVEEGRVKDVERLLNEGANVDHRDMFDRTPLMAAAFDGHADVVSLLLVRGADVNARNENGGTALHMASFRNDGGRCVKLLIDGGAQLQCKNRWGQTALHEAASRQNEGAVRVLLVAGASNAVDDNYAKRPSDYTRNSVIRHMFLCASYRPPP